MLYIDHETMSNRLDDLGWTFVRGAMTYWVYSKRGWLAIVHADVTYFERDSDGSVLSVLHS